MLLPLILWEIGLCMRKQLLILLLILLITVPSMAQEESISLDWPPPVYHVSGSTVIAKAAFA